MSTEMRLERAFGSLRRIEANGVKLEVMWCITLTSYMEKRSDVAVMAILAKKLKEKVLKSRQNVNRDKSA